MKYSTVQYGEYFSSLNPGKNCPPSWETKFTNQRVRNNATGLSYRFPRIASQVRPLKYSFEIGPYLTVLKPNTFRSNNHKYKRSFIAC